KNRRYRYPFIACTNCGPRFTIVKRLPYDWENTSTAERSSPSLPPIITSSRNWLGNSRRSETSMWWSKSGTGSGPRTF
ncbi:MAG TPA: hypothetical protein EYP11_00560, partial [Aquificaceae bacterium]|nr:hypothetical protein [Aquificaceae bacterium]